MFGLNTLMVGGVVAAVAASALVYQNMQIASLKDRLAIDRIELAACGARLDNLVEDLQSDAEIDAIPDELLTTVPDHWLRPTK